MESKNYKNVHIVGVGGAACSYLAGWLNDAGYVVSGCDLKLNERTAGLVKKGIKIYKGHAPQHLEGVDWLIYTNAIPEDAVDKHPEIGEAKRRGIKVSRHGEASGELMKNYRTIAVSGTHGKTTTTMMVGLILERAGLDPNYFVGEGIYRYGQGNFFVIEACEYRNMFLSYYPYILVITNIELDHPDAFKNIGDVVSSFKRFVDNVTKDGIVIGCIDSMQVLKVLDHARERGLRIEEYGENDIIEYKVKEWGSESRVLIDGKEVDLKLHIPGKHNVLNAIAAIRASILCGIDTIEAAKILESYKGIKRRMEILGEINGTKLISDCAHHPTQIKTVLNTLREQCKFGKLVVVYEPHQYERTLKFLNSFSRCWGKADILYILPIYKVVGRESKRALSKVSAEKLIDKVKKNGFKNVYYVPTYRSIDKVINKLAGNVDVIAFLNAGPLGDYISAKYGEKTYV